MRTLIVANIVSSNLVYRLNTYIKKYKNELGEVLVLFCAETESNRKWTLHEKPTFQHKVLQNRKVEIGGADLFTYFLNFSAWSEFESFNPDNIVVTGWSQFTCQLSYVWATIRRKKITLWSGSTVNELTWRRLITLPLVWLMVRMSNRYIAYGIRAKKYLISLGAKPEKITIFMNDVNKTYFKQESLKWRKKRELVKNKLKIDTKFNFIYVGQLIERKGILGLINTFKLFKSRNPDWGLVIVGSGKQGDLINSFVRKNKIRNVYFLGNIEQYDLPKIYTTCDCLVLPSKEEVWGLVVNEALYCELKVVVSSKCGCIPELMKPGFNGYPFDPICQKNLLISLNKVSYLIEAEVNKKPFFSIVTCTKNSVKYLNKNIASVKNQSFKYYEHIFIDGFSNDGTVELIKNYQVNNPARVFFYQAKAKGISNAMNIGIGKSKGKYILILHSDDSLYRKDILDNAYSYLTEHSELDWVYGKINVIEENGKQIGQYPARWFYKLFPKYFLKFYNTIPHQGVFMKKSVFEKFGVFDETLPSSMDIDLWMRVWNKTKWLFWDKTVSNYMVRRGAQSSGLANKPENDKNVLLVRRRHHNSFEMKIFNIVRKVTDRYNTIRR